MSRKSQRSVPPLALSYSLTRIFHHGTGLVKKRIRPLTAAAPFVYFIRDLLSERELLELDTYCSEHAPEFSSSFTEDGCGEEVVDEQRTSTFIHLKKAQNKIVRTIEGRVAGIVSLPSENIEPIQIVSYTQGQYFNIHHDAGTLDEEARFVDVVVPRRVVTVFVYLNTLPAGQGQTVFPYLALSVRPERGCAVMFCNLLPDGTADYRTSHQANPVTEPGLRKVGMNVWVGDTSFQGLVEPGGRRKKARPSASAADVSHQASVSSSSASSIAEST